jgi:hypothetical protein
MIFKQLYFCPGSILSRDYSIFLGVLNNIVGRHILVTRQQSKNWKKLQPVSLIIIMFFSKYPLNSFSTLLFFGNAKLSISNLRRRYYHKDPLHGEVEVYDKNGKHIDVFTPEGNPHPTKGKVNGREIPM